ncbi:MAG: tricorn protease [Fimbriimonadales bacterium]|nr:MAG: tricorn protease [Fimbriimonadales bacterium]
MRNYAFVLASLLCAVCIAQSVIKFARFPAPSPDGTQIAFSWQGDLWVAPITGGVAQRLTVHPAYDFAPIWSPDGKKIAFTSDRHGNDDVFVLHLDAGTVQRLTYFSGRDRAYGWTPDSKAVLFESRRESEPYGADFSAYVAPLDGGTPYRLHKASGSPFALAPDGKRLAFVRRDSAWWRKGYKGSAQGDLWLVDLTTQRYTRLTDTDTPDTFPMWSADGRTLYFVSERDGTANLYAMDVPTKRVRLLTRFKDDGVRFPQISANGKVITFEQGMEVYRLDTATGAMSVMSLQVPAQDRRAAETVRRAYSANVEDYAIAPDAKEFVYMVRGELFAARFPDGGPSRNLTETVEPESNPQLAPDGKTVYFDAERDGTTHLFKLSSDDPDEPRLRRARKHRIEPLTNSPQGESNPRLSPDGKLLAFQRGQGELVVMHLETKQEHTLTRSWNLGNIAWSPDSRWIAFDRYDENYNSDVFLVRVPEFETPKTDGPSEQAPVQTAPNTTEIRIYNISQHPRNDFAPSWSADGRALVFLSERETDTLNICHVWLRREDYERTRADREDEEDDKHDAPKKEEKKEPVRVAIDFEDIHLWVRLVTRYPAGVQEAVVAPDGEQIAFRSAYQGQADLYTIKWDGSDERRLTTGGLSPENLQWSKDGKTIYFLSRGRLQRIAAAGGSPQTTRTDAEITIDLAKEREYLYDAAWRTLNETFYDPNFHGVNWAAMREKYRPYLPYAQTDRDFTAVVLMMLGELRSSHLSFSLARSETTDAPSNTGMLGVVFSNERDSDGLLIERVLPNTPASRTEVNLQAGERILAIEGKPITRTTNVYQLLDNTVGKRIELRVRGADGNERTVFLRPTTIAEFNNAVYRDWVERNRRYVAERTGGRVGYVHIQAMGEASLREFERDLYAVAYGKDALIIDVRYNGGGRTADYLLAMLHPPRHAYTIGRNGERGYPQDRLPVIGWHQPIAVLCNERSFSNAEIFSHAIKTLKRGPLVGVPTAGGVISTGQRRLMDGSSVSTPGRGWFTIDKGINLEGNGALPDYLVDYTPDDEAQNRDPQLERAVEIMRRAQ